MRGIWRGLVVGWVTLVVGVGAVSAAPWKFAVMSDTQWAPAVDHVGRGVAIEIIASLNQEFIRHGVAFVIEVGDLTDNGGEDGEEFLSELNIRAAANLALQQAGIRFFPLRGNHEDSAAAAKRFGEVFAGLPGTAAWRDGDGYTAGTPAELPGLAGLSYAFAYRDASFVLLDQFTLPTPAGQAVDYPIARQQPWITAQLAAAQAAGRHAFVFSHKNLLGQNHKDNLFGTPRGAADPGDADPAKQPTQTAFCRAMADHGARWIFSGHDHLYHRALVTSPDAARSATVQQIIAGSNSYKFYDPRLPYSSNEQPLIQERKSVGYLIVTVDGPRVQADYYSVPCQLVINGNISSWHSPGAFPQADRFGYSTNGQGFVVAPGESFTKVLDAAPSGPGWVGSRLELLGGENTVVGTTADEEYVIRRPTANHVTTGWQPAPLPALVSDVVSLWGMRIRPRSPRSNPYCLALSYDTARVPAAQAGRLTLLVRTSRGWVPAVSRNTAGRPRYVEGAYTNQPLGTAGVLAEAGRVWAVLDYDGDFAVGVRR
ncbi:MAG: metallophosphoesterase [Fimbriimonadaceae bacterium]|nr:metallophosphoesterase [Fimbriimonadaceae bacterium]